MLKIENLSLPQLLKKIEGDNQAKCFNLLNDHKGRFEQAPGSLTKHQNWVGGYIDHIEETMNIACSLYLLMTNTRNVPFTLSDAILVLFLHDLEKPFKYVEPKIKSLSQTCDKSFVLEFIKSYNFHLSPKHLNALDYVHGEGNDYHPTIRIQKPLAAFVHICDVMSARIWYSYPIIGEINRKNSQKGVNSF